MGVRLSWRALDAAPSSKQRQGGCHSEDKPALLEWRVPAPSCKSRRVFHISLLCCFAQATGSCGLIIPIPRQTGSYICQTHYMGTRVPAERDTCSIPDFQPCPTLQLPSSPSTDKLLRCGSDRGGMRTQDCRFGDCDRLWDDFTPPTDRL